MTFIDGLHFGANWYANAFYRVRMGHETQFPPDFRESLWRIGILRCAFHDESHRGAAARRAVGIMPTRTMRPILHAGQRLLSRSSVRGPAFSGEAALNK